MKHIKKFNESELENLANRFLHGPEYQCTKIDKYLEDIKNIFSDFILNISEDPKMNCFTDGFIVDEGKIGQVWYSEYEYNKYVIQDRGLNAGVVKLESLKKHESIKIVLDLNKLSKETPIPLVKKSQNRPSSLTSFMHNSLWNSNKFLDLYQILAENLDRISELGLKYLVGNETGRGGGIFEIIIYIPE